jgi:hypothetical protein
MTDRDRTARRVLLLVGAVLVGTVVVVGGVSSTAGLGGDDAGFPAFAFDVDITVPSVTFDAPGETGNETARDPGVSPLPVVPNDGPGSGDDVAYTGHYRQS